MFTSKINIEKTSQQYTKKCGFSKVWKTEVCILQVVLLITLQQVYIVIVKVNFFFLLDLNYGK